MDKLEKKEVNSVVSYIGVNGGYLGNFSYNSHADFYPHYCGLDINPFDYEGTTKERFIEILSSSTPEDQAKILRGVLEKYPLSYHGQALENEFIKEVYYKGKVELHEKITKWANELQGKGLIELGELTNDFEYVKEVLNHAETLISQHSFSSAIDRVHAALHGYLKEICKNEGIIFIKAEPKIQDLWSEIKQKHPKFKVNVKEYNKPINQCVDAIGKAVHNINDIRNQLSYSHPNDEILEETEAKLVINLSRVLLQYIDDKVTS
ncbi:abortive infection family protein [Bacillus mycoides]|uniref:abortive infection family protein n=1 Tax=Bacillus mycoides TaxID=1405 RepID=UPI002E1D7203|nr:abortive infection family protein [Bacillus mycoides]